ncbi:hypothetical protein AAVH_01542 [Aphelenchoides avenae]|nr:hypothetical protein AAVH_01542 [Aphelenchus avenae]
MFIDEPRRFNLVAPLGHALSIRDYIQLGIYVAVLCNVACYHSVCLWLILTILQACDWVFKFGVFVAVTTVSIIYGPTCRTQDSEFTWVDCYLFMAIYITCMILQVLMDLIFNVILFKCWRAERALRGDATTTTITADVDENAPP